MSSKRSSLSTRILPFALSAFIILIDQLTKWLVVRWIPFRTVGWSWGGDFFRIIHTRNLAVAFSLGHSFPPAVKLVLFILVPLVVLVGITVYLLKSDEPGSLQRS